MVARDAERCRLNVPDGQDAAGLGETSLLLDTTNSLLEDGRNLGRGSLGLGVCASLHVEDGGCGISGLRVKNRLAERPKMLWAAPAPKQQRIPQGSSMKSSSTPATRLPRGQKSSEGPNWISQNRLLMFLDGIDVGSGMGRLTEDVDLRRRLCRQQRRRRRRASTGGGRCGTY